MEPFVWAASGFAGQHAGSGLADTCRPNVLLCARPHHRPVTSRLFLSSGTRCCRTIEAPQRDGLAGTWTRQAKRTLVVPSKSAEDNRRLTALAENLAATTCTPFLGSGASSPHLPTGGELAADWARKFGYPFPDGGNLARVMQYVATMKYAGDVDTVKQRLVKEYFANPPSPDFSAPHQVHRVLAECSLPLYVTTNYDDYMFRMLDQTPSRRPRLDISPWYVADSREAHPSSPLGPRRQYEPSAEEPLVFHLHGHHSIPRSLVLTEDDNIDYLVREAGDTHATGALPHVVPDYVRGRLRTTPLLFLGYSLQDWTFHVLFRRLLYGAPRKRNHVSVQIDPSRSGSGPASQYVEKYLAGQNIWIFWESTEVFMSKLVMRLRDVTGTRRGSRP